MSVIALLQCAPVSFCLLLHESIDELYKSSLWFVCKSIRYWFYCDHNQHAIAKIKHILSTRNLQIRLTQYGICVNDFVRMLHKSKAIVAGGFVTELFTKVYDESSDMDIFVESAELFHDTSAKSHPFVFISEFLQSFGYHEKPGTWVSMDTTQYYIAFDDGERIQVFRFENILLYGKRIDVILYTGKNIVSCFDMTICMSSITTDANSMLIFEYFHYSDIVKRFLKPSQYILNLQAQCDGIEIDFSTKMRFILRVEKTKSRIEKYTRRGFHVVQSMVQLVKKWDRCEFVSNNQGSYDIFIQQLASSIKSDVLLQNLYDEISLGITL